MTDTMSGGRARSPWRFVAVGAVPVVLAVAVVGVLALGSSDAGGTVERIAVSDTGPDPFGESIQAVDLPDMSTAEPVLARIRDEIPIDPTVGGPIAPGTLPGFYAVPGSGAACDVSGLRAGLGTQTTIDAWSAAAGVGADQIDQYLAGLAPVFLGADTLVLLHGTAGASTAVLQAGTAVLVDDTGTPRVRCRSLSPLSAVEPIDLRSVEVTGTDWPGFEVEKVVQIQAGATVSELTVVDLQSGALVPIAVGSEAAPPAPGPAAPAPPVTDPPAPEPPPAEPEPTDPPATAPSLGTCDATTLNQIFDSIWEEPAHRFEVYACDGKWAYITADVGTLIGASLFEWVDSAWSLVDCDVYRDPNDWMSSTVVPAEFWTPCISN